MAEIPVERKTRTGGGLPWWLIPLLLLLLLIPLLFLFSRGCNDAAGIVSNANNGNTNRAVATTTTNTVVTNTATTAVATTNANATVSNNTGAAISDVSFLAGVNDKNTLVGRRVDFNNVKVTRVLSDRVFTVGSGAGETFVLLDKGLDSEGGKEQQIKMRPGQTVNIDGDMRSVPNVETQEEKSRQLNQKEYAEMRGQQVYLHATSVADAK